MSTTTSTLTNRAKSQQKTRDALVVAGASLIAQNGYSGASVRDIASLAGYTQGAFYSNFQSKDDLVFAIMRAQFQEAYASIATLEKKPTATLSELACDAAVWLQDICGSDEKALLIAEISLHAMRDEKFASTYDALLEEHALKMSAMLEDIAQASHLNLSVSVEHVAKGMIALTRGLRLMEPRQNTDAVTDILRLFLESILRKNSL